jgi:hypothetical protein
MVGSGPSDIGHPYLAFDFIAQQIKRKVKSFVHRNAL